MSGHLLQASVWPTLEMIVEEWPAYLCKQFDPEVGLALIPSDSSPAESGRAQAERGRDPEPGASCSISLG
jgi:hypothetical protein